MATNTNGGFVVVTYVNSVPVGQAASRNVGIAAPLLKFLKVQPKALGVVQIMIGLITFLFGIVMPFGFKYFSVPVVSGIVYWASLIYVIAGSLSVAAETNIHSCLVKGSLGMNVVSAIVATPAIIIFSVDCIIQLVNECCGNNVVMLVGTDGVLAVLSFVQLIVSICISAFACRATCCIGAEVEVMTMPATAYANTQGTSAVHNTTNNMEMWKDPPMYNEKTFLPNDRPSLA